MRRRTVSTYFGGLRGIATSFDLHSTAVGAGVSTSFLQFEGHSPYFRLLLDESGLRPRNSQSRQTHLDDTDDGGGISEPSSPLRAADPRSHTPVGFSLTHEGAPVTAKSNGRPRLIAHVYNEYVIDEVHVNRIENAWSLFKRGLMGMYHHVSAKYLQDYLDEFAFRYSHRKEKEKLFDLVLSHC